MRTDVLTAAASTSEVEDRGAAAGAAAGRSSSFWGFLKLGVEHILTGYDHLLFLFGLLVACRRFSTAAKIITCFTLAHSLTLALAALEVVSLPGRVVEPLSAGGRVVGQLLVRGFHRGRRPAQPAPGGRLRLRRPRRLGAGLASGRLAQLARHARRGQRRQQGPVGARP
jgi:hypothetical protein